MRRASAADIPAILPVFDAARQIMRSSGNHHQWADDYPSTAAVESDLQREGAYVIEDHGRIVAYFACLPSPEPTYSQIYDGQWLDDSLPYYVVHRIASYPTAHHIFRDLMDYCFAKSSSPQAQGGNIRIDTHRDNSIMQHLILTYGFTYCGIIHLANGDERLAYQKVLR
ncbi:MAG: N-acetyltransferase [Bacteroidaceae bacterium]|nr:N-acetyltransferase [Bacteroidaceae bacterium]